MNIEDIKNCINQIKSEDINNLKNIVDNHQNVIILGNGGSNSISSHISQDYTKVLGKKSISFSDPSRLTCYINDYGFGESYAKFIEHFADNKTLVILISSSGNSSNIVNAGKYCSNNNISYITLTGFSSTNILIKNSIDSLLNFYVNSNDYGVVECTHQIILHSIL